MTPDSSREPCQLNEKRNIVKPVFARTTLVPISLQIAEGLCFSNPRGSQVQQCNVKRQSRSLLPTSPSNKAASTKRFSLTFCNQIPHSQSAGSWQASSLRCVCPKTKTRHWRSMADTRDKKTVYSLRASQRQGPPGLGHSTRLTWPPQPPHFQSTRNMQVGLKVSAAPARDRKRYWTGEVAARKTRDC